MKRTTMSVFKNMSMQILSATNATQESNSTYDMGNLSPFGFSLAAVILFAIMIFGVLSNLIVVIVIGSTRRLRTPMNTILLNLSISDFLIASLGTPLSIASAIQHNWIFGDTICQVYAFMMTLAGK